MAVTINGTTGIAGVDGSASTPAVQGTDTNTGIAFPAADTVTVATGGSERMRVDSSGNVGIGTTSPSYRVHSRSSTGNVALTNSGSYPAIFGFDNNGNAEYFIIDGYDLRFQTGGSTAGTGTERARITSGGYFKASNSGSYLGSTGTYHEVCSDAASSIIFVTHSTSTSYAEDGVMLRFARNTTNGTFNALVYYNTGATAYKFKVADSGNVTNTNGSYGTISDIKIKQDITDATPQWDDIKNLRFRKYRLKNEVELDPNAKPFLGLIAQEAELVCPGLIEESRDTEEVETTDADGNVVRERRDLGTTTKSIKTSILYMKAVKALQEAQLRIETLEAQNAAFEARLAALEAK